MIVGMPEHRDACGLDGLVGLRCPLIRVDEYEFRPVVNEPDRAPRLQNQTDARARPIPCFPHSPARPTPSGPAPPNELLCLPRARGQRRGECGPVPQHSSKCISPPVLENALLVPGPCLRVFHVPVSCITWEVSEFAEVDSRFLAVQLFLCHMH